MGRLAITFAVVWLRRTKEWAKVAAIVMALLAAGIVFIATFTAMFWSVAIILVSAHLLFTALRPRAADHR